MSKIRLSVISSHSDFHALIKLLHRYILYKNRHKRNQFNLESDTGCWNVRDAPAPQLE